MESTSQIITWLLIIPALGIGALLVTDKSRTTLLKGIALSTAILDFIVSVPLFLRYDAVPGGFQFVERVSWIESLGVSYHVGVDGISLLLIMLTTFLGPLVILSAWRSIEKNVRGFMISYLMLQIGMLGVFVSLDIFLFYVFWEAMLIPMYFIIGVWGGPNRIYAAVKFVLFTMFGSLLMLVGILVLYFQYYYATDSYTCDLIELTRTLNLPSGLQYWLFGSFAIAFAIKVPMFPFHTWLPDAHVEAPTAGSVILAGVLLKMGTYGFLRFCFPLFPEAVIEAIPLIMALSIIGIIYGALVSMVQPDIKKLVAYSSVSHLGFVMGGMFALNTQGVQGSVLQMINHGLSTGGLFLLVGVIYERRHTRLISDFGGLANVMPVFSTVFLIVVLSSLALPGTNGFVGEFLILVDMFQRHWVYAAFAATGVILAAVYLLWMYQRVVFGKVTHEENKSLPDLSARELGYLIPIVLFIFWIGIHPGTFTGKLESSVESLLETVRAKQSSHVVNMKLVSLPPDGRTESSE